MDAVAVILSGESITRPVRRLPLEMLSEIFKHFVENWGSPWTLVKVCKSWKYVALITPYLWSRIRLINAPEKATSFLIVDGEKQYFSFNDQLCFTEAQLQSSLARCGVVPLTVIIDYQRWRLPTPNGVQNPYILFSQPFCERIEHLKITGSKLSAVPDCVIMENCQFPRLKILEVYSDFSLWEHNILERASQLDELKCTMLLTSQHIHYSFWPSLKRFNYRNLGTLNLIAPRLKNIEAIEYFGSDWPDSQTPHITWNRVREIKLCCDHYHLQRLHLPQLESLDLQDSPPMQITRDEDTRDSGHESRIHFPRITRLSVATGNPGWITEMDVPELRDLSITSHHYAWERDIIGDLSPMPKIETLTLDVSWEDRTLVNLLMAFPAIKLLTLRRHHQNLNKGVELFERLTSPHKALLLPYLKTLRLGDPKNPVYTRRMAVVSLLRELLASREKLGRPLKELSVCWMGAEGRIDNYA